MRRFLLAAGVAGSVGLGRMEAAAQAPPETAEQPEILIEEPDPIQEGQPGQKSAIDIANLVTSAAKSVTTVQEAPSIVTVITADEIKRRGYRTVQEAMTLVPGWLHYNAEHGMVPVPTVRGTIQALLMMRDGISLFSPWEATTTASRIVPIESIKRIEAVTGPGGVLWGANSFLGVLNLITKDAEDVDGIEVDAGFGDGRGDRSVFRAYGMLGKKLGALKIFQHVSYENFIGPEMTMPQKVLEATAPQPNGPTSYGPPLTSDVKRSWALSIDGKYTVGPVSLIYAVPFKVQQYPLTFPGSVVTRGEPDTVGANEIPGVMAGSPRPFNPTSITDPLRLNRDNVFDFYERYGILEYRDRFSEDKVGINAKAYYVDFDRDFPYFDVYTSSQLLEGGLTIRTDLTTRRYGGTLDADVAITPNVRLLAGAEGFREEVVDAFADVVSPAPERLPFACPPGRSDLDAYEPDWAPEYPGPACKQTFVFDADRSVAGGFVDLQLRLHPKLLVDGGVRLQQAGGKRPYDLQTLSSGALVWHFAENWHLKLNYAQGFRPPVFNNTDSNGEAIQYAGSPDLVPETSQAGQIEVNARLLRGVRRVRELNLRADYSYTVLDQVIVIAEGRYRNSGKRGIHNAEFLANLFLQGDHFVQLGYTFIDIATEDRGTYKAVPNHWLSAGLVFSVIKDHLDVNSNVLVIGALEDPNRIVREQSASAVGTLAGLRDAHNTDLTLDRIRPTANLQLGVRAKNLFGTKLEIAANVYNVLDQKWFYWDGFYELSPRLEVLPNPGEGIRFFAHATYKY